MIDRTNETPGADPYGPCGASAMHNEPPAFRYKGRTYRAEPGECLHCGRHVEIGRLESGATRPWDPAWHDGGDFGCDSAPGSGEDGCGDHARPWDLHVREVYEDIRHSAKANVLRPSAPAAPVGHVCGRDC